MKTDWLEILVYVVIVVIMVIIFFVGFVVRILTEPNDEPEPARYVYLETLSDEMLDGTMMYGICRYDRREGDIKTLTVYSLPAFRRVMKELEVAE